MLCTTHDVVASNLQNVQLELFSRGGPGVAAGERFALPRCSCGGLCSFMLNGVRRSKEGTAVFQKQACVPMYMQRNTLAPGRQLGTGVGASAARQLSRATGKPTRGTTHGTRPGTACPRARCWRKTDPQ